MSILLWMLMVMAMIAPIMVMINNECQQAEALIMDHDYIGAANILRMWQWHCPRAERLWEIYTSV